MNEKRSDNLERRADNIDILKAILAFLIVCIHVPFPGEVGSYFTTLTRVAVPTCTVSAPAIINSATSFPVIMPPIPQIGI